MHKEALRETLHYRRRRELETRTDLWQEFAKDLHGFRFGDVTQMRHAFRIAEKEHEGKTRVSGEPFIRHPMAVGKILYEAGFRDYRMFITAFLHDVVEDTDAIFDEKTRKNLTSDDLGKIPQMLVDKYNIGTIPARWISALTKGKDESLYHQVLQEAEPEVQAIKLADRIHNLETIDAMPPEKQQKKWQDTLKYYLPLFTNLHSYKNNRFENQTIYLLTRTKAATRRFGDIPIGFS